MHINFYDSNLTVSGGGDKTVLWDPDLVIS